MVNYVKGDLFHAPLNSYLLHSCNCKGAWGAGIALQFKKKFPITFRAYKSMCDEYGKYLLGTCFLAEENGYKIACLFTSSGYGDDLDSESEILSNTFKAFKDFEEQVDLHPTFTPVFCMPKINSGLFKIDWLHTEKVVNSMKYTYNIYEV